MDPNISWNNTPGRNQTCFWKLEGFPCMVGHSAVWPVLFWKDDNFLPTRLTQSQLSTFTFFRLKVTIVHLFFAFKCAGNSPLSGND